VLYLLSFEINSIRVSVQRQSPENCRRPREVAASASRFSAICVRTLRLIASHSKDKW